MSQPNDLIKNEMDYGLISPEELTQALEPRSEEGSEASAPASAEAYSEDDLAEEGDLSYEEGLDDGMVLAPSLTSKGEEDVIVVKRESTRSTLAILYTLATFFIFLTGMFIAVLDGLHRDVSIIENMKEVVPLISGVFLGTLGFVLGYYFRKEDEK